MNTPNTTNKDECRFVVYEVVTRKNNTTYHHTKKRCKTREEAEIEACRLMERTCRFHDVKHQ